MRYMMTEELTAFSEDCISFLKNGEVLDIKLSTFEEIELI